MRVLCAQPPDVRNAMLMARSLRLVWDMLQRRGIPVDVYQVPGVMPLLVIGQGRLLICTHLDDQSPAPNDVPRSVPSVSGSTASGPGVTRMAGLLGALGPIIAGTLTPDDVTVVVEADRHIGSPALQSWLDSLKRDVGFALWEATDLPIPAPVTFISATGTVSIGITVTSHAAGIESFYAGVVPDVGHRIVEALASVKSRDSEVLVTGFYDGVEAPDSKALALLEGVSKNVQSWVLGATNEAAAERELSARHVTLGVFCAPSILIRSLELTESQPFLPSTARAVIEARIMPGQDAHAVVRALTEHVTTCIPEAQIDTLLLRQPYQGSQQSIPGIENIAPVYPIAPGDTPAGLIGTVGIPSLGFATVSRAPNRSEEQVELAAVSRASDFVASLSRHIATLPGARR